MSFHQQDFLEKALGSFLSIPVQTTHILPNHIKLQIDYRAHLKRIEISVLVSVWNNGYTKLILLGIDYRQTNSVYSNGSFFNGNVVSR